MPVSTKLAKFCKSQYTIGLHDKAYLQFDSTRAALSHRWLGNQLTPGDKESTGLDDFSSRSRISLRSGTASSDGSAIKDNKARRGFFGRKRVTVSSPTCGDAFGDMRLLIHADAVL